jgi:hypothetical protein
LLFLIFPFLTRFAISARDRRDQRNIRTLRGELRQIIKDKKASGIQDDTLLSHMLKEDLVKDDF